nr:reverse transcriptase domain-containing protein [Tanacetum cinerariifolium]
MIEESKDLTSLSLDELIRNLKVHEMIIKNVSQLVKAKGERKSLALNAKKESCDEESLTSRSEDEEYVIAVRDFKKFFKRRGSTQNLLMSCGVDLGRRRALLLLYPKPLRPMKIEPKKKTTRASPATTTTTTTPFINAQLKALIDQGIVDALAARDADRSMNDDDSHNSGTDQKICTLAERQAENKRKLDNNNQAQQQPPKKQGVAIAYTARPGKRKEYARTLPLCNKCKFHHNGQCTVKCANCKKVGHLTRDCRSPAGTNNQRNLTCYECGNQGHYRSDWLELKNQNHENQAG